MPTLTEIKKRKLLEAHHIQALEDRIIEDIRDGKVPITENECLALMGFQLPDGSEQTVFVVVEEKDIVRLRKKLQSTLQ
jgi:hypothetical protein